MVVLRTGWPFFVAAGAFLVLAYVAWQFWPLSVDPCSSGSYAHIPGVAAEPEFYGGKRSAAGIMVPAGLAVMGLLVASLGLVPMRRQAR